MSTDNENTKNNENTKIIDELLKSSNFSNELEHFTDEEKYKECKQKPIDTGFPHINKMLGGGLFPGIAVLGAMPATGKSSLALQIAFNVAQSGTPVMFFSYEMSPTHIAAKALSRFLNSSNEKSNKNTSINARSILNANNKDDDEILKKEIPNAAKELKEKLDNNLFVFKPTAEIMMGVDDILKILNEFCKEHPAPLVIIDYLQILSMIEKSEDKNSQMRNSIDSVVQALTFRAHDEKNPIPILVISSIGRAKYEKNKSAMPEMDIFKESGFIEYSADYAFALGPRWHTSSATKNDINVDDEKPQSDDNKESRPLCLTVLKNRYGEVGAYTDLVFYPAKDLFIEDDDSPIELDKKEKSQAKASTSSSSVTKTNKQKDETIEETHIDEITRSLLD